MPQSLSNVLVHVVSALKTANLLQMKKLNLNCIHIWSLPLWLKGAMYIKLVECPIMFISPLVYHEHFQLVI